MDNESVIWKVVSFSLEVCATCMLYHQYRYRARCLKSLKEAPYIELDNDLKKTVEDNNGVIQYAAISGKIQALAAPLRSQFVPHLSGVIREKITVERKVQFNPFLHIWGHSNSNLHQIVNTVPFALCKKSLNVFKKRIHVEVTEPLVAQELLIPTIYDEFQYHPATIGDTVFDIFRSEKTIGIQEIEKLLCEDETLLAVGQLVIENNKLKIKPPDEGLTYFLTPLSLESLISKENVTTKVLKFSTCLVGAITLAYFIHLARQAFSEIKRRINFRRARKKYEEERRLRRIADKFRNSHEEEVPKCIVCLENPIEVILLECGHLCLCYNCSEHIHDLCPVCRNQITRTVSAFWA